MPEKQDEIAFATPISVDLSPFGPRMELKSFYETDTWAVGQIDGIGRMLSVSLLGNKLHDALKAPLREIHTLAISAIDADNLTAKKKKKIRDEIEGVLDRIANGDSFLQGSSIHNSITQLLNQRNYNARGLTGGIIGYPLDLILEELPKRIDTFKELTITYMAGAILAGRLEPNYTHTKRLFNNLISEGKAALQQQATAFQGEVENRRKEAAAAAKDIKAAQSEMIEVKKEFVELKASHEAEMDKIRDTFRDELALKEPATYWNDKRKNHRLAVFAGAAGFLAVAGFGVYFMWNGLPSIIESISGQLAGAKNVGSAAELAKDVVQRDGGSFFEGLSGLALVTIPAIVFLWILKLFARVFVENLHSLQDASQRSTMVVTYLSLLKDESKAMTPSERLLILEALFRPQTKTSGDDGPPHRLINELVRGSGR